MVTPSDSFDDFRLEVEGAPSAEAAHLLLREATTAAGSWSASQCHAWTPRLLEWLDEDGVLASVDWQAPTDPSTDAGPDSEAVLGQGMHLLLAVRARLRRLGEAPNIEQLENPLRHWATIPVIFELPRRELLPLYRLWIEEDFVPGLSGYREQVVEKATRLEVVELAEQCRIADGESFDGEWLIRQALTAGAIFQMPELLPAWLAYLRPRAVTPCDDAEIDRWQGWLERLPGPDDPPPAVERYLQTPRLEFSVLSAARQALDEAHSERWTISRRLVESLLERDFRFMTPSRSFEASAPGAREALRAYEQLGRMGQVPTLLGCSLLTLALEAEARWALARGLRGADIARVHRCGLMRLARFACGRPVAELEGIESVAPLDAKTANFLEWTGKIRNRVHHNVDLLQSVDHARLRRAIFDERADAPRVMQALASWQARVS